MAYDKTEPRVALIFKVGTVVVLCLLGVRFGLDSYFVSVNESVAAEMLPATHEPLVQLREAEQKHLTQTGMPISAAMTELAKARPAELAPQPSEDLGPMTGWSKAPKKALAVPTPGEVQACKAEAGHEAHLAQLKAVQKQGGSLSFPIDFAPNTDKLDAAKPSTAAALQELVTLAQGCPELTFDIAAHSSKEGAADKNLKLTEARAVSVKTALLAAGVRESAIGATSGAGSSKPAVDEPEADSEEAKKLGAEKLEALRAMNRRVTITVTKHCP